MKTILAAVLMVVGSVAVGQGLSYPAMISGVQFYANNTGTMAAQTGANAIYYRDVVSPNGRGRIVAALIGETNAATIASWNSQLTKGDAAMLAGDAILGPADTTFAQAQAARASADSAFTAGQFRTAFQEYNRAAMLYEKSQKQHGAAADLYRGAFSR